MKEDGTGLNGRRTVRVVIPTSAPSTQTSQDLGTTAFLPLRERADVAQAASWMVASDPWRQLGYDTGRCEQILGLAGREPWGLWVGGQLKGFLLLCFEGPFVGYVQLLGVAPDARGQGWGTLLLRHAEQCIFQRSRNVFICVSSFNEGARRFYARQGYFEVGRLERFLVQDHDEILLRKTLGPILGR